MYTPKDLGNEYALAIVKLIDLLNYIVVLVSAVVTYFVFRIIAKFNYKANKESAKYANHNSRLEAVWTTIPSIRILITRVPSFNLLYWIDESRKTERFLNIEGNQWYWSYEFQTLKFRIEFDAGLLTIEDLTEGIQTYRLACTSAILLPIKTWVKAGVSSQDVLHSWAIPTRGIKRDACPGRTNQLRIISRRLGSFFGQCSEFCGRYHGYRPIELRFTYG